MRLAVSAEWLRYCVRLWSTSVDQSDSARGVSTPAIAGQASSAQAILRGQVLGTISEGCNTPRVPAHCCIPLRSLYSDISQCDFRRVRARVDSRNTFPDGLVCVRPPVSAEWLWYCVRLWSMSVDQSYSARAVSTPARDARCLAPLAKDATHRG